MRKSLRPVIFQLRHPVKWLLVVALCFWLSLDALAQKTKTQKPAKKPAPKTAPAKPAQKPAAKADANPKEDEGKIRDIVAFLAYVLNAIGSNGTPARDKDVLITESYSKIFRDAKVQVEDDLDEGRKVITNKDVTAYLKDVDFFFKDVKFEFVIEDIKSSTMTNGQLFYKVSLRRTLTGTTVDGKSVSNSIPRFIEINYDPEQRDLKIASIYTNEFDEREALEAWWRELSFEWKSIFTEKLDLSDSVTLEDIKNITSIEDLDLNSNRFIQSIEPLGQLINLKLLDLSATSVTDLTPIRNLTELVELTLANTTIQDLSPLRYSSRLVRLNIDHTRVSDISVLDRLTGLQNLSLRGTGVSDVSALTGLENLLFLDIQATQVPDISAFSGLQQLAVLNVSQTSIANLSPISSLTALTDLDIDSTKVADLSPLQKLDKLKVLHANYTPISDLQPLQKLPALEKVYCDQTDITREKADAFMSLNRKVLVVFDSKDLKAWWQNLSSSWKAILSGTAQISQQPTNEELAKITNIDSISFRGNTGVLSLEPLGKLLKLKTINASGTSVIDLSPLAEHVSLVTIDVSGTNVSDISVLSRFANLKTARLDRTQVKDLRPLYRLKSLEKVYADDAGIEDTTAIKFLEQNAQCLLVYKTTRLDSWWSALNGEWKEVFREQLSSDTVMNRDNLHRLIERKSLRFADSDVSDLSVLAEFIRLTDLQFSGTAVQAFPNLENLKTLRILKAANSPIRNIAAVAALDGLEELDLSSTPLESLDEIEDLQSLKKLNCAGTQIRKLDPLENLRNLRSLDCSNTNVAKLQPVLESGLTTLKCFNTKISSKEVQKFRDRNPECNIVYYR